MIQVLQRAFEVIEFLGRHEGAAVKDMAPALSLKKSTLCNILTTLVQLDYLRKEDGGYFVGGRFLDVARSRIETDALLEAAREAVGVVADSVCEGTIVAVLKDLERYEIATARPRQGVTVDPAYLRSTPLFAAATGRVVVAFLDETGRKAVVRKHGLPVGEWEGVSNYATLKTVLDEVRGERQAFRISPDGQVEAVGVPVFAPDGSVLAAIGSYVPTYRFRGKHRKAVIDALRQASNQMTLQLESAAGQKNVVV